jgi:hypothetical protein
MFSRDIFSAILKVKRAWGEIAQRMGQEFYCSKIIQLEGDLWLT